MSFRNVTDATAAAIEQCHDDSRGDLDAVTFPAEVFAGMSAAKAARVISPGPGLRWHWDGPPRTESVVPGVSTVECRFRATQDG